MRAGHFPNGSDALQAVLMQYADRIVLGKSKFNFIVLNCEMVLIINKCDSCLHTSDDRFWWITACDGDHHSGAFPDFLNGQPVLVKCFIFEDAKFIEMSKCVRKIYRATDMNDTKLLDVIFTDNEIIISNVYQALSPEPMKFSFFAVLKPYIDWKTFLRAALRKQDTADLLLRKSLLSLNCLLEILEALKDKLPRRVSCLCKWAS